MTFSGHIPSPHLFTLTPERRQLSRGPDESEEDDAEYFDENTSDEIDEEGNPPDTPPAGGVKVPAVGME
ncbi:hypothetical protein J6590_000476 [Homalodisca vitripennis]|nr:hypothetical protein J6590_000476 [Homalodisca vitripennis]